MMYFRRRIVAILFLFLSKVQDVAVKLPDTAAIPPPQNLELNRQFVEKDSDTYCLSVCWEHPPALPPDARGYNVYVNNTFDSTVGVDSETSVLLSGIPRNQVVSYAYVVCCLLFHLMVLSTVLCSCLLLLPHLVHLCFS